MKKVNSNNEYSNVFSSRREGKQNFIKSSSLHPSSCLASKH